LSECQRDRGLPQPKGAEHSENILSALDYDRLDDHPSMWVPNVQVALLQCFTCHPKESFSLQIIDLYTQGAIMQSKSERNNTVKAGLVCLALGIFIGWLLF